MYGEIAKFLQAESVSWKRTAEATSVEELIEVCGRICYMSFGSNQSPRTTAEYITNLVVSGHESVLEHASWTFIVLGVSRAFTHQLVRHRVGFSFSQLSQQYHDERSARFVIPPELLNSKRAEKIWVKHVENSLKAYEEITVALKKNQGSRKNMSAKEYRRSIRSAARSVLPNATETKVAVTANARALRHFLDVRGSIPGDIEMRKVAAELLRIVRADAPAVFADFSIELPKQSLVALGWGD